MDLAQSASPLCPEYWKYKIWLLNYLNTNFSIYGSINLNRWSKLKIPSQFSAILFYVCCYAANNKSHLPCSIWVKIKYGILCLSKHQILTRKKFSNSISNLKSELHKASTATASITVGRIGCRSPLAALAPPSTPLGTPPTRALCVCRPVCSPIPRAGVPPAEHATRVVLVLIAGAGCSQLFFSSSSCFRYFP